MTSHYSCWLFLAVILLQTVFSAEIKKREAVETLELDPIQEALLNQQLIDAEGQNWQNDREKRLGIIKKVGIKAILLNVIFNKIDRFIDSKTRLVNQLEKQNIIKNEKYFGITPPPKIPANQGRPTTSTMAPIEFSPSSPVSLVIPDRLYGNSFQLITNISEAIGDVLFNTADRAQEFSDRLSDKVKRKLGFVNLIQRPKKSTPPPK